MSSPGQIVETIGRVLDEPQDYQKDQEHCQYGIFTAFLKTWSGIMVPSQSTVVIKTLVSFSRKKIYILYIFGFTGFLKMCNPYCYFFYFWRLLNNIKKMRFFTLLLKKIYSFYNMFNDFVISYS